MTITRPPPRAAELHPSAKWQTIHGLPRRWQASAECRRFHGLWRHWQASAECPGSTAGTNAGIKRGVAPEESAQRGTSGAANGGGGRSAPDPAHVTPNEPYGAPDPAHLTPNEPYGPRPGAPHAQRTVWPPTRRTSRPTNRMRPRPGAPHAQRTVRPPTGAPHAQRTVWRPRPGAPHAQRTVWRPRPGPRDAPNVWRGARRR